MPPKFRLVVDALNANDIEEIYELLRIDLDPENVELDDNGLVYCYANTPHAVKRVRQDIKASLGRYNVLSEVTTPICVERWNAQQRSYVGATKSDARIGVAARARIRRPLTDVRWIVTVEPAGVFNWAQVREELSRRGRPILEERGGDLNVPAVDEQDARQLAAELGQVPVVRRTSTRRLGWFERWRRREQVLGNYSSDPSAYYGL